MTELMASKYLIRKLADHETFHIQGDQSNMAVFSGTIYCIKSDN